MSFVSTLPRMRESLLLNGDWSFALDPQDTGEKAAWFSQDLDQRIRVPGSWEEQGFGAPPPISFLGTWTKTHEYEGAAWYSRTIDIPATWQNQHVELHLKGVRWRSRLWLNDKPVGERDSLSTDHIYDLTAFVQAGQGYRLTIQVDNRLIYPLIESHPNSEHTATRWGGITGGVELTARPEIAIQQVKCLPDVARKRFNVEIDVPQDAVGCSLSAYIGSVQRQIAVGSAHLSFSVDIGSEAQLWWDDDPYLYDAAFVLEYDDKVLDTVIIRVGLREISTQGKNILLNGRPVFLRGYVDCCIFPLTGYPSWDIEHYRRQFRIARSYGFNHVRLHSWTAPEPFWQAADELGMLVQSELPNWTVHYGHMEKEPPQDVHDYFLRELDSIVRALHFHPSWVLFSNGNELIYTPAGHSRLIELSDRGKQLDPTRLFTDNTGFGQLPAASRPVDYYIQSCNWHPPQKIYDAATADTTQDFSAVTAYSDRPLIGHEHGQFTMYVRPSEAEKYTGVIHPTWLESVNATLEKKGFTSRVESFIRSSGIHSVRTYKETLERARRTRGLAGVQLLDIRDFPGQGHATTGILDVFWDDKGLIEPSEFAQCNNAVVLLMRSPSPNFWTGQPLSVEIEISNFGHSDLPAGQLQWSLVTSQAQLAGELSVPAAPQGALTSLGRLTIDIPPMERAHAWELIVEHGGARNSWHLWTFPYPQPNDVTSSINTRVATLRNVIPQADFSDDFAGNAPRYDAGRRAYANWHLAISDLLTSRVLQYLHDGGRVWLMPEAKSLHSFVKTRYLPPFWSYLWFPDNTSTVMGMQIHDHPALGEFPHDGCSDWQWYRLVNDTPAICLDAVPHIQPIIEVVDNFNRAKRLSYAFEAQVGRGRLFVSTWRLYDPRISGHPEARFLFRQVAKYLQSDAFAPTAHLSVGELLGMFKLTSGHADTLLE